MNENQDNLNNTQSIYCSKCGFKCNKTNRFCINCGTPLITNNNVNNNINNNQQQGAQREINSKKKKKINPLAIVIGIIATVASILLPIVGVITIILAILSLFKDKYRSFGITVFICFGLITITVLVFIIILFGLCFASI